MKMIRYVLIGLVVLVMGYLILPEPGWPEGLPKSVQSGEPGDVANLDEQRAYFTDMTRAEVLEYFTREFSRSRLLGIPLPTYRLNYPPEEAQVLIREQTRSSYLEEIVHPWRESFYVNGYEPKEDEDKISVDGQPYRAKVTVRYVKSWWFVRIGVYGMVLGLGWWIGREFRWVIQNAKFKMQNDNSKLKK